MKNNKYNLAFCLDSNFIPTLSYVFTTFVKHNDPKLYNIYFITYDIKDTNEIIKILKDINEDFNIFIKEFIPSGEFIELIKNYEKILRSYQEIKTIKTFINMSNWSRFFIYELLPDIEFILYIDLDVLFNESIIDLIKDTPNDKIIGAIPYIKFKSIKNRKCFINKNYTNEVIKKFKLNISHFNNNSYNCGVIYFNLKLWKANKLTKKIINILTYIVKTKKTLFFSGTEIIQNVLIPNYKSYNIKYNRIIPKKVFYKKNDFAIAHYKGYKKHWENSDYIKKYNELIKKT